VHNKILSTTHAFSFGLFFLLAYLIDVILHSLGKILAIQNMSLHCRGCESSKTKPLGSQDG
jgi:hypothetical protein